MDSEGVSSSNDDGGVRHLNNGEKLIPMKDKSALVLDDGKIYKIQHKRQRQILSCVACHKRKIKCDRIRPTCGSCHKNEWQCTYFVNARVSRGGSSSKLDDETQVVPNKASKEELLKVIEKAKQLEMQQGEKLISDQKVQQQRSRVKRVRKASKDFGVRETGGKKDGLINETEGNNNGKKKCTNANANASSHAESDISDSTRLIEDSVYYKNKSMLDFNKKLESSASDVLKLVWDFLPSIERANELYVIYTQNIHMILPLIDLQHFENDHHQFWESITSGESLKQPDFLLLLFPILYASVKSLYHLLDKEQSQGLLQEMSQYKTACLRLYSAFDFPNKYSIKILTGFVLLNSVIENPSVTTIAQLTRLCQRARLTKDPLLLGLSDSSVVQSKRILFWQIFQLDTMTSLHNNLSPLIKLDEFDTSLPVEVINGTLNPSICYINANYRFVLLLNELCQKRGSFSGIKERIVDLHVCCMGSALSLNNHLSTHRLSLHEAKFIQWAMYMLNTLADRSLLLLHLNIISTSIPTLHNRKLLKKDIRMCDDPIVESGYGKDYNVIQTILNNSGNLDLTSHNQTKKPMVYNFENLTNNLVPASLHFLDEFVKYHSTNRYACFNWELLVGNMPINAITFALKMLALDANRAEKLGRRLVLNTDLRYILLSKAIPIVEDRLDIETAISKNCFRLAKLLFQLLVVKFGNSNAEPIPNKYDITYSTSKDVPQPTLNQDLEEEKSSMPNGFPLKSDGRSNVTYLYMNNSIPSPRNTVLDILSKDVNGQGNNGHEELFDDTFFFSGNLIYNSELLDGDNNITASCAQIAPRTMKAISSHEFDMKATPHTTTPWDEIPYFISEQIQDQIRNNTDIVQQPNSFSLPPVSVTSKKEEEIKAIYKKVQDYIILFNSSNNELEYVASGDEYYRDFENALLEVLCGILTQS